MGVSYDLFNPDNVTVLSTDVTAEARGTTIPPSYLWGQLCKLQAFTLLRWDSVSLLWSAFIKAPFQLPVIPAGPGSAGFLMGTAWPCTHTGKQTEFSKHDVNLNSVTGLERKTSHFVSPDSSTDIFTFPSTQWSLTFVSLGSTKVFPSLYLQGGAF